MTISLDIALATVEDAGDETEGALEDGTAEVTTGGARQGALVPVVAVPVRQRGAR